MAEIAPFRGLRYNLEKIDDLAEVVIPPYDVISPKEQEAFHRRNRYNMVRLELGEATQEDSEENNPHARAARYLEEWWKNGVLIRDDQPALYYYEVDYSLSSGLRQTRSGFICALRLEDFSSGRVRPHERTFQAVKDERLRLMMSCHANLSPVFALYSDEGHLVGHQLRGGRESQPVISFSDDAGMEHRVWRVCDREALERVRALMMDKAIFIADGHHRYETALAYRSLQMQRFPHAGPHASFQYIMVYLSNMNQDGLRILPTHRLLRHLDAWTPDSFLERALDFFHISSFEATEAGQTAWRSELETGMTTKKTIIAFYGRSAKRFYLFRANEDAISAYLAEQGIPEILHGLDVVVLDQVILRHLLGLHEGFLSSENNIHFRHELSEALEEVRSGRFDAGFFINPTRIEQVQEVAGAGLIMPHKSTYFYPKVGSGIVIRPLIPEEEVL